LEPIITKQSLKLGSNFDSIKRKIETDSKYCGLRKLCKFYPDEKRIEYSTERIYPSERPGRIPILFLFSNPHPDSVRRGLLFSEPRSKAFWQRLFESKYFRMRTDDEINLEHWNESTPKRLGQLMVEGRYESDFLLYSHCFYPVPTNQLQDFKNLFKGDAEARKAINIESRTELIRLAKKENVKHIVVFTVPLFQMITQTSKPGWRGLIKRPKYDFPRDEEVEKRRAKLSMGNIDDIDVYMSLDTRWKNVTTRKGERYFALILNAILNSILKTK